MENWELPKNCEDHTDGRKQPDTTRGMDDLTTNRGLESRISWGPEAWIEESIRGVDLSTWVVFCPFFPPVFIVS